MSAKCAGWCWIISRRINSKGTKMKEIENRLFLYGKTRVKHVILDKWLRTGGDVDYEWQAKLLMHEILSQPLRQTESNFVGMLANAIADQKDGFEPHFEVYCNAL